MPVTYALTQAGIRCISEGSNIIPTEAVAIVSHGHYGYSCDRFLRPPPAIRRQGIRREQRAQVRRGLVFFQDSCSAVAIGIPIRGGGLLRRTEARPRAGDGWRRGRELRAVMQYRAVDWRALPYMCVLRQVSVFLVSTFYVYLA